MFTSEHDVDTGDVDRRLGLFADVAPLLCTSGPRLCSSFAYSKFKTEWRVAEQLIRF